MIVTVIGVTIVVTILTAWALVRTSAPTAGDVGTALSRPAAPTTGIASPSASPTSTPAPTTEPAPRADERFLVASSNSLLWRAQAGACNGPAPFVQRSTDGGATWADVTPHTPRVQQIAALEALGSDGIEIVAGVGPNCTAQLVRSFTAGQFWETSTAGPSTVHYTDLTNPAVVHSPTGAYEAPCADPTGLRSDEQVTAIICNGTASWRTGNTWTSMPVPNAAALAVSGGTVTIASTGAPTCAQLTLTRFATPEAHPEVIGCTSAATSTDAVAIAELPSSAVATWSGTATAHAITP